VEDEEGGIPDGNKALLETPGADDTVTGHEGKGEGDGNDKVGSVLGGPGKDGDSSKAKEAKPGLGGKVPGTPTIGVKLKSKDQMPDEIPSAAKYAELKARDDELKRFDQKLGDLNDTLERKKAASDMENLEPKVGSTIGSGKSDESVSSYQSGMSEIVDDEAMSKESDARSVESEAEDTMRTRLFKLVGL
jgi:hypothetical protein